MEELKYFFSYVRTDSEFVLRLAKKLRAVGANLWLDQLDILGGQHWDSTVEKALRSCKGMIVVLSPESVASDNVMDEVSYALDEGKLVVPVLIRSCNIPFRLRRVQYIDFTADYDTGFSRLLRALRIEQPGQPPESTAIQEPVVQEPSLPKKPEPTTDELDHPKPSGVETAKVWSKSQKTTVLGAICIVALIAIVSIVVIFKYLQTYNLSITANGGSVTKEPNKISYKHGETVTLTAVPDPNYVFDGWSGLSYSTNPANLVMDADKTVTANFGIKARTVTTNTIGMKLVYIPAGSFMMGSCHSAAQLAKEYKKRDRREEKEFTDELPQHEVRISEGFWMGQTEVTQGQYKSVMKAEPWSGMPGVQEDADNPAVYVSWDDANDFCKKLSQQEGETYRLPTEAEWEYTCRAGETTRFSFGDNASMLGYYAWFFDNAYNREDQAYAHPVGQKEPNPWGLYDMHGNVEEWCSDWYDEDYYSNSPSVDPNGPSTGTTRSLRGGSWSSGESVLRCSERNTSTPDVPISQYRGFRVVRSQP